MLSLVVISDGLGIAYWLVKKKKVISHGVSLVAKVLASPRTLLQSPTWLPFFFFLSFFFDGSQEEKPCVESVQDLPVA